MYIIFSLQYDRFTNLKLVLYNTPSGPHQVGLGDLLHANTIGLNSISQILSVL